MYLRWTDGLENIEASGVANSLSAGELVGLKSLLFLGSLNKNMKTKSKQPDELEFCKTCWVMHKIGRHKQPVDQSRSDRDQQEECKHNSIGHRAISHDTLTHPTGPQVCFECNRTVAEIIAKAEARGFEKALQNMNNAVEVEFKDENPGKQTMYSTIQEGFLVRLFKQLSQLSASLKDK